MSDFEIKASSLLKALEISGSNEEKLAIVCCYLDDTYQDGRSFGWLEGYDERDTEIPTGDNS